MMPSHPSVTKIKTNTKAKALVECRVAEVRSCATTNALLQNYAIYTLFGRFGAKKVFFGTTIVFHG